MVRNTSVTYPAPAAAMFLGPVMTLRQENQQEVVKKSWVRFWLATFLGGSHMTLGWITKPSPHNLIHENREVVLAKHASVTVRK